MAGGGTGGIGGAGGAGCEYQRYFSPGCGPDATPRCTPNAGGACGGLACGCNGQIIVGCPPEFSEPYAYIYSSNYFWDASSLGTTCDPTSDAGH